MRYTYRPARANQGACVGREPPHSTDWVGSLSSPRRRSLAYEKRSLVESFNIGYADQTIPVFARWFGSWRISVQRLAYSSPELTRRYDRAASGWSRTLERLGFPAAYETLLRRVLDEQAQEALTVRPRVLDCGVGTGALSSALARVLPTPFELDAIDMSRGMLEQARRSFCNTGLEATLRRGDVRALPYGSGVFDLVMTSHVLEHLGDPAAALNEIVRVLKPGGLLITCLTRRSPLGMIVHLKWRTHQVTPVQAESWLIGSGLENTHCLSLDDRAFCRQLSVACVGRKPRLADARRGYPDPVPGAAAHRWRTTTSADYPVGCYDATLITGGSDER